MNLSSITLPPVEEKTATIFMALELRELSKSTWLVALHAYSNDFRTVIPRRNRTASGF